MRSSRVIHGRLWLFIFGLATLGLAACGGDAESASGREAGAVETGPLPYADPDGTLPAWEAASTPEATLESARSGRAGSPLSGDRPASPPAAEPVREPVAEAYVPPIAPEPEPQAEPVTIPVGALITARIETTLSTRTHGPGDRFHARVTEEVLARDGMVLVPEGSRIEGRVEHAERSPGSDEEAVLVLVFDALGIHGQRIPIVASVVETEIEAGTTDSGARTAATIATGAAAGAVVGRILGGNTRSTVVGAAAGAAVGTGIALTTREGHAVLREGSRLVIRIDETVILAH
jgi:hypothetical protein